MKISIIVATYNRCESVKRILDALATQTFPSHEYEVIISIDGSEDGSQEMINTYRTNFALHSIWNTNSGSASARNRGIQKATGDVLIFIDDDMEPSHEFVESHYHTHSLKKKLCKLGASPIVFDETSPTIVRYIGERFNSHLTRMSKPGYKIRMWDFYSGNFSIRKDFLLELGAFNESFRLYGYEDVELAYRIIKSGGEIVYDPNALCTQYYNEDLKSLGKKIIESGKTAVLLVTLHPETFDELQFREYNHAGWKWRSVRLFLIWLSISIPMTTDAITFLTNLFEKYNPKIHKKLYFLAMDYFFWLGVWSAIKSDKGNTHLISKIRSYKNPE